MKTASGTVARMGRGFWVETLGCPKNRVDSDKLVGTLTAEGLLPAPSADEADLVVVNTCAFIEEARQESIDTILALSDARRPGAELVVTGCMAERYGDELATALPEVDRIAPFGTSLVDGREGGASGEVAVQLGPTRRRPDFDLLNLPRPSHPVPWAYVKVAEGCDRTCGFCAIPSFRGAQRSRTDGAILDEVDRLAGSGVREVVLVAQDLASYGADRSAKGSLVPLVGEVAARVDRVRLLYLYPSELTDELIDTVIATGVPYFDLSLQHAAKSLLRRMRRWGDRGRFLERIESIRAKTPDAAFRTSFIVGYPGETQEHHDELVEFLCEARLDWVGLFPFSLEEGTHAATQDGRVDPALVTDRINELSEVQDPITAASRDALVGSTITVLVDTPGVARSHREAPEIDGVVHVPGSLPPGHLGDVTVLEAAGIDLVAAGAVGADGDAAR